MDLGLSDDEFWNLTLREYDALQRRHREREQVRDYRAGIMPSIYVNAHQKKSAKTCQPLDFFPRSAPQHIASAAEITQKLSYLMGCKGRTRGKSR